MQQEHLKNKIVTYSKGANTDVEPELLFASEEPNGQYIDALNARTITLNGSNGAISKINGEEIKYSSTAGMTGYYCVGAIQCNNYFVEFYAPPTIGQDSIVRINGQIALKSNKLGLQFNYPLQLDKNESDNYNEVFVNDYRIPPYIFNVKDMFDSISTQKYFSEFNLKKYQINIQSALDIPKFIELVSVGGGGGKPVGHYQYHIRYVSKAGDRTNWSHGTPMIPVLQSYSSESREYPYVKTYGSAPNPEQVTGYAPKIRFRVTNLYDYDYIEIKCTSYNAGAGIDFVGSGKIVAKIGISPQEISVRDYIDVQESNVDIALSEADETNQIIDVERAKSIRYFNRRLNLMNVKLASKESNLTFRQTNGQYCYAIKGALGKAGHNDPYNHVYRRHYTNGERYGFGVTLYDGVGNSNFVTKYTGATNFQFPNRRDPINSSEALAASDGVVIAATTGVTAVHNTYEVFDHYNSVYKSDSCNFKNIRKADGVIGVIGSKDKDQLLQDCGNDNFEAFGGNSTLLGQWISTYYRPFTPTSQNDTATDGHNYRATVRVNQENTTNGFPIMVLAQTQSALAGQSSDYVQTNHGATTSDFYPSIFGLNYYATGIAFEGVQNFPSWAKSFAIVRTKAAKRVLCQGLGFYRLNPADFKSFGTNASLATKNTNSVWFYSPDIEHGLISTETVNDIINNPANYKVQLVSPLGFTSEVYSYYNSIGFSNRDKGIDMIVYSRMLRDKKDFPEGAAENNKINPFEDYNMGYPLNDYNYVRYQKFRNIGSEKNVFGSNGNLIVGISGLKRVSDGRGNYFELTFDREIYNTSGTGGVGENGFMNNGLKNWTEPLYMINIIREGANINANNNIQQYLQTDHYQKLESIIGKSDGNQNQQKYLLVDERPDDVVTKNSNEFRFLYVRKPDGTDLKFTNVTHHGTSYTSDIIADINANGGIYVGVSGVFTHEVSSNGREFTIVFNGNTPNMPQLDDLIIVKYDETAPIKVFGGDSFIGETIFAPIDREGREDDKQPTSNFPLGIGLPYLFYKLNPRLYQIKNQSTNVIQDNAWLRLAMIRQMCVMFTCESRAAIHLAFNLPSTNSLKNPRSFFPLTNYIMRPFQWDVDSSMNGNNIHSGYVTDYGEDERGLFKYGGFRFQQNINPDYSTEPPLRFFSKPEYGYVEQTEFKTRIMWSLPRVINSQDSAGLKTFAANSHYDIDDKYGQINLAYSALSGRGENLYAFTERGICLLVTNKTILSELDGNALGAMPSDGYITNQLWITGLVGIPLNFWRSAAEAYFPIDEIATQRQQGLFFANNESVFLFMNDNVIDVGRLNYFTKVREVLERNTNGNAEISATYNKDFQEYLLHIKGGFINTTIVFSKKNNAWNGQTIHNYEKLASFNNTTFGIRNGIAYELNKGYKLNGLPVQFNVISGVSADQFYDKEFVRIRLNTLDNKKPNYVYFYKKLIDTIYCRILENEFKNYRGNEQFIPRGEQGNRNRLQGRLVVFNIMFDKEEDFTLVDSSIFYKLLK